MCGWGGGEWREGCGGESGRGGGWGEEGRMHMKCYA